MPDRWGATDSVYVLEAQATPRTLHREILSLFKPFGLGLPSGSDAGFADRWMSGNVLVAGAGRRPGPGRVGFGALAGTGTGAWHPQCTTGPQAGDQLPLERATAPDEQGLVDHLVRDAHGLIIGEVHLQPVADLFRTPRCRPVSRHPMMFFVKQQFADLAGSVSRPCSRRSSCRS